MLRTQNHKLKKDQAFFLFDEILLVNRIEEQREAIKLGTRKNWENEESGCYSGKRRKETKNCQLC